MGQNDAPSQLVYSKQRRILMSISGINQGMLGVSLKKPNAEEITSRILKKIDADGDGVLCSAELGTCGKLGEKISTADKNGDGLVSHHELLSKIMEKLESFENREPKNGKGADINRIKCTLSELLGESETDKSSDDLFTQLLEQLGGAAKDVGGLIGCLKDVAFSIMA
jgi:Ca2+-binding EF-hand superfamily protein